MFNWLVVMAANISINMTNITQDWVVTGFSPYVVMFGNFFWGMFFGFIGAGIYVNSPNTMHSLIYLAMVGFVFAIILPYGLVAILGLLLCFFGTVVVYRTYISHRSQG